MPSLPQMFLCRPTSDFAPCAVRRLWLRPSKHLVLHATCSLRGAKTTLGTIERIKDGDGSPFPVVIEGGRDVTFAEAGFEV